MKQTIDKVSPEARFTIEGLDGIWKTSVPNVNGIWWIYRESDEYGHEVPADTIVDVVEEKSYDTQIIEQWVENHTEPDMAKLNEEIEQKGRERLKELQETGKTTWDLPYEKSTGVEVTKFIISNPIVPKGTGVYNIPSIDHRSDPEEYNIEKTMQEKTYEEVIRDIVDSPDVLSGKTYSEAMMEWADKGGWLKLHIRENWQYWYMWFQEEIKRREQDGE